MRRRSAPPWLAGLLASALVPGCADDDPAPTASSGSSEAVAAAASIRLLDRLDQATVEGPFTAALDGTLPPARPEDLRLDEAPAVDRRPWFEGSWERAMERERAPRTFVRVVEEEDGPVLGLPVESRGLHRLWNCEPQDALWITARVRGVGEVLPSLQVQSLRAAAPPALDRGEALPELPVLPAAPMRPARTARAGDPDALGWVRLQIHVPPEPDRRSLRISLLAGEGGALIDRVQVRAVGTVHAWILEGRTGPEPGASRLHCSHEADQILQECLALPGGTRVSSSVRVPARRPRLDTEIAFERAPGAVPPAVELWIDGRRVARCVPPPDGGWASWIVPLDDHAGRAVELELRCDEGDHLAFLGAPWVLGESPRPRPNLVLISLDTVRADHLGCYGARPSPSPTVDALAASGLRFAQTYSPSSYTLPAHASLMTGQHPLVHGALIQPHRLQPARSPILARTFRQVGHRTAAFTGGGFLTPAFGFAHGFESFDARDPGGVDARGLAHDPARHLSPPGSSASVRAAMQPALRFLDRHHDQPFFLFFHSYFVHNYVPDPAYCEGLPVDPLRSAQPFQEVWDAARDGDPDAVSHLGALYTATLRQADAEILAPLLARLDSLGLREDTLVVLLSDHGEEFQEHGTLGHGRRLWNTLVRVPLILRGPGIEPGVRDDAASLIDVSRTLLHHLGLPLDERLQGRDLLGETAAIPLLLHLANRDRRGNYDWDALVDGPWKLLRQHPDDESGVRRWLFRPEEDPAELRDRSGEDAPSLQRLESALGERVAEHLRHAASLPAADAGEALDESLREMLRRLGYEQDDERP